MGKPFDGKPDHKPEMPFGKLDKRFDGKLERKPEMPFDGMKPSFGRDEADESASGESPSWRSKWAALKARFVRGDDEDDDDDKKEWHDGKLRDAFFEAWGGKGGKRAAALPKGAVLPRCAAGWRHFDQHPHHHHDEEHEHHHPPHAPPLRLLLGLFA